MKETPSLAVLVVLVAAALSYAAFGSDKAPSVAREQIATPSKTDPDSNVLNVGMANTVYNYQGGASRLSRAEYQAMKAEVADALENLSKK
jgi:hypothetical protein